MAKLILIRHGQSMWNKANIFTGWVDVPLSEKGIDEALVAGENLKDEAVDLVFASLQIRSIQTAMLCLSKNSHGKTPVIMHSQGKMGDRSRIYSEQIMAQIIPVYCNWRLNERYYGKLQGLNKAATAEKYGKEQVHLWRRSFDVPPPAGESLEMTSDRTIPYFTESILPEVMSGKTVLLSAHGNSLRSIVMYLDNLSGEQVLELEIPTGHPIEYDMHGKKLIKR